MSFKVQKLLLITLPNKARHDTLGERDGLVPAMILHDKRTPPKVARWTLQPA
jgi:hypothetical protein